MFLRVNCKNKTFLLLDEAACVFLRGKNFLGPGQTGNVWRPNTIKHCLVTKHANVEVSGQTV